MYKPDNENLQKAIYKVNNKYGIPQIQGIAKIDENVEFIGFNYCKSCAKRGQVDFGVHFFLDDYQFNRLWNKPNNYKGYTVFPNITQVNAFFHSLI